MNVFGLRNHIVEDYSSYVKSFIRVEDKCIKEHVGASLGTGLLWPDPSFIVDGMTASQVGGMTSFLT